MADIKQLNPIIRKWEGGYINDPTDKGGATNMGVTIATWKRVGYDKDHDGDIDSTDIKLLSPDDFNYVLKSYWNTWKADQIVNQKIANILVDWVWGSGKWGVIIPQRILGLKGTDVDGQVGNQTLGLVNAADPVVLLAKIYAARQDFLHGIVAGNPSQVKYIKGWLNRLADFK